MGKGKKTREKKEIELPIKRRRVFSSRSTYFSVSALLFFSSIAVCRSVASFSLFIIVTFTVVHHFLWFVIVTESAVFGCLNRPFSLSLGSVQNIGTLKWWTCSSSLVFHQIANHSIALFASFYIARFYSKKQFAKTTTLKMLRRRSTTKKNGKWVKWNDILCGFYYWNYSVTTTIIFYFVFGTPIEWHELRVNYITVSVVIAPLTLFHVRTFATLNRQFDWMRLMSFEVVMQTEPSFSGVFFCTSSTFSCFMDRLLLSSWHHWNFLFRSR